MKFEGPDFFKDLTTFLTEHVIYYREAAAQYGTEYLNKTAKKMDAILSDLQKGFLTKKDLKESEEILFNACTSSEEPAVVARIPANQRDAHRQTAKNLLNQYDHFKETCKKEKGALHINY